jgi:hypothetical protein
MSRIENLLGRRGTGVAIVLLGLAARLLYLLAVAHQPLVSDASRYYAMAGDLAMGRHFVPYWPPGLPLYLATFSSAFGGSELVARVAMLPLYLLLCFALYKTAVHLTSNPACGNLALLPLALAPGMIAASVEPITELPAAALMTLVACSLTGIKSGRAGSAPLALGVAIGCLALLRPASLILLLVVPVYLAWRSRSLLAGFAVCLIPVAMVAMWIGYVHRGTGQLVMINTANARNFYLGNNPETPLYKTWWMGSHHEPGTAPPEADTPALGKLHSVQAREYIVSHPGLFLLRTFNRVCVFFAFDTYTGAYVIENYGFPRLLGLAIIALDSAIYCILAVGSILYLATLPGLRSLIAFLDDKSLHAGLLLVLSLLYASPYFLAFSHPRYHFPLEPLLMAAAAAFALPFLEGAPQPALEALRGRRVAVAAAIVLFVSVQIEFALIVARTSAI